MYKIIALIGKAGSGKDTVMHRLIDADSSLHEIISCTTRPRREGESNGVNYFFMTPEQFGDKVLHDEMLEATYFNEWFYGTSYESLRSDSINVGVFNPAGIDSLLGRLDVDLKVFYINTSSKTRLIRQLNREKDPNVDEIIRRYKADEDDFNDLNFSYTTINNESFDDLEAGIKVILSSLES